MSNHCNIELSDRDTNCIAIRPGRLLCLKCMNGGGCLPFMEEEKLDEKLQAVKDNPQVHIKLETSFDEMGARNINYFKQPIHERKRDLDVLQKLGLLPGDVRIARDLFEMIDLRIKNVGEICGYNGKSGSKWPACPLADKGYFEKGGVGLNKLKSKDLMQYWKEVSCKEIEESDHIVIRPHHMLCIICYIAGSDFEKGYKPLAEDNLYELWMKMRNNPDIPVTLVDGPGDCMICPPCHGFDNDRKLCFVGCHLRDRKKDAETFQRLDLLPGDTLPARELVRRIYERIPSNFGICSFEYTSAYQWKDCSPPERYQGGLKKGFFENNEETLYGKKQND